MKTRWPLILLVPLALTVSWFGMSRQAREQTAFLERTAHTLEHAQTIAPETEDAINNAIAAIRWRTFPAAEKLDTRRQHAIERIDAALLSKHRLPTGQTASHRELPRYLASE